MKAGSSQNSNPARQRKLRHGLTGAAALLMPGEDLALFQVHCREYREHYNPRNNAEKQLVQAMAEIRWRLNRVMTAETNALAHADTNGTAMDYALNMAAFFRDRSKVFVNISLYEQRLLRRFRQAEHEVRVVQLARKQKDRERARTSLLPLE